MPAKNAVIMDNFFPRRNRVELRNGSSAHATIPGSATVETLMEYIPASGTAKMFAAAGTAIYDATAAGAASSVATGMTSAEWVYTQVGTGAGHFILAANGADTLQLYNGTTWANSTITGLTLANVAWVNTHQKRVWLGEKDSLRAYFLPVEAVAGAASSFNLETIAKLGGYLVGMGTWTRDGGDGADDLAVFLTSEGEVIIYQGTDPSSASTWALVGVFRIGRPLNRRSMLKAGSDLVIATEAGIVPLSRVLGTDTSQTARVALSDQIDLAFADAVAEAPSNGVGWQIFLHPKGNMLIINVPRAADPTVQFVFNTLTGAPCRFIGLPASCWGLLNDIPYYGGAAGVIRFDDGTDDQGEPIVGDCLQAFSYFGSPAREKRFSRVEPILEAAADPRPTIDILTDFEIVSGSSLRSPAPSESSRWDVFEWDVDAWGAVAPTQRRAWEAVVGHGRSAAIRMQVNSLYASPSWVATNWLFTAGGNL